jgi:hypothetical protein
MSTFQTRLLNELAAGHDGAPISESTLVFLRERFRTRFFDFLMTRFNSERACGLNKAKLARRIRKPPEVINRWLGAPSNLTLDSISDLMAGIGAEEPEMGGSKLLNRSPTNYFPLSGFDVSNTSDQEAELKSWVPPLPAANPTSNRTAKIGFFRQ